MSVNEVPVQVTFPFPGAGLAGQVTAVTNIYSAGYINLIVKHFYKAQKSVRNCWKDTTKLLHGEVSLEFKMK